MFAPLCNLSMIHTYSVSSLLSRAVVTEDDAGQETGSVKHCGATVSTGHHRIGFMDLFAGVVLCSGLVTAAWFYLPP